MANRSNFKTGEPYRFIEYGKECCVCPGVDYDRVGFPAGKHIRVGKGLAPFAFHQDCEVFEANKHRVQVVPYLTNAGVKVNVIYLEGDHDEVRGGAYVLAPLEHPTAWESGKGLRTTFVFSPQDPIWADWNINYEVRGELSFLAHNEGSACISVVIRNDRLKVKYYLDAKDGDGGGARCVRELPFAFKQFGWYELRTRWLPIANLPNTWALRVRLSDLADRAHNLNWRPEPESLPNRIVRMSYAGFGDEQQGIGSGCRWLVSVMGDDEIASVEVEQRK